VRGDSDTGTAVVTVPARPRLAAAVRVHPPRGGSGPWVLEREGRHYYRVGPDLARLAGLLTGDYDEDELLGLLGERWTAENLRAAIEKLLSMKLLDDGSDRAPAARRLSVVPPMSVQFSVLDPSRLLEPVAPVIRVLGRRPAQLACWALALGGLLALALAAGDLGRLLSRPVPGNVLLIVAVGAFVGIVIHELSHGATLMHFGARPRRMGLMLFYLFPAFFCDVSDGWLLSERVQRVRVALAGIFAQLVFAGSAAVLGACLPASTARDGLLLLAVTTYLAGLVNLVPLVKLDGYLALMSLLDTPNLRTAAMADARNAVAQVLYGARRERTLARWAVPYGLACMAFPLYLVGGVAFALWSEIARGAGILGALLVLSFLGGLCFAVGSGFVRLQRNARQAGAGLPRMLLVNALLAAGVVTALTTVPVTEQLPGFYQVDAGGARLLVPTSVGADRVEPGRHVELRSNGLVARVDVGAATVGRGSVDITSLPMDDVLPLGIDPGLDVEVASFPLELAGPLDAADRSGVARVVLDDQSLGEWLFARYVEPVTGTN
jgi:putative peptide zinc metalloprotease protein